VPNTTQTLKLQIAAPTQNAKSRAYATPGFSCVIDRTTDLGLAMIIAELPDGTYQPVGLASSLSEAEEVISTYRGPAGDTFRLWARGLRGEHKVAATFTKEGR
jgi:hypothetical protein